MFYSCLFCRADCRFGSRRIDLPIGPTLASVLHRMSRKLSAMNYGRNSTHCSMERLRLKNIPRNDFYRKIPEQFLCLDGVAGQNPNRSLIFRQFPDYGPSNESGPAADQRYHSLFLSSNRWSVQSWTFCLGAKRFFDARHQIRSTKF